MTLPRTFALATLLLLAACGGRSDGTPEGAAAGTQGDAPLPRPEARSGSVTGMPDKPGPGHVGIPAPASGLPEAATALVAGEAPPDEIGAPLPADGTVVDEDGNVVATPEPDAQDAAAVVRAYYAAIDAHDYARAWGLWSDGGRSSGQTLQQFADGFAATADVAAQVQAPGRIDAAAGSRYVEVPVTIVATDRDGAEHHYRGTYTLRRAMVDGATPEQRAWRIASADVHELDTGTPPP